MKNFKRVVATSLTLSLAIPHMVLAAPSDVHHKDGGLYKTAKEMGLSATLQKQVGLNSNKYYYEGKDGKLYTFSTVNKAFVEVEKDLERLLGELESKESVGQVEEKEELEVIDISAINATTISVNFSNGVTEQFTLETPLVKDVETDVTFEYEGQTFTGKVTWDGEEVVEELKVVEVSAINSTQAEVTFSKEVKEVKPANFKVTDKDGNVLFVNKAELSAGKTVATLTFFNDFADKGVYTVQTTNVADVDGNVIAASTDQFGYQAAEVAKVEFTSTTIAPGKNVKDIVKVTDTLGRDVTGEVEIKYESSNDAVVDTATGVTAAGNAIVVAKVGDVKTASTTITVKAVEETSFVGFNVFAGTNPAATTEDFGKLKEEDKKTYVSLGSNSKIALYFNDQYGDSMTATDDATGLTITNLTPAVAILEEVGGDLVVKPISQGTAYVKVKKGTSEATLQIEVKKASIETVMELDKSDVSVVANSGIKETVKVTFKDQYDGKMNATNAVNLEATSKDKTIATAVATGGNAVEVTGLKEGSTTVEVSYKVDATTTLKKTINVTVTKAGDLASYKAEVATTELDKTPGSPNAATGAVSQTEVKLYAVDENGSKINPEAIDGTSKKLVVVDKDGKEITNAADKVVSIDSNKNVKSEKVGTGYVQVKVGTLVIDTLEFTVVDTASTAAKVEFNSLAVVLGEVPSNNTGITDLQTQLKNIVTLKDQYGNSVNKSGLVFTTSVTNIDGFKSDLSELTAKNASATIVVTEAKDSGGKNLLKDPVIVQLTAKDTTAPVITGVEDGDLVNADVTPASAATDIDTVELTLDGSVVSSYTALGEITVADGEYVLTVTDKAGNVTVVNFTADVTKPTFTASITDTKEITVVFSEEVDKTEAEKVANYTYDTTGSNVEVIVSATLQADGKTVVIVTTTAPTAATSTIDATVEDLAGNASASSAVTLN